MCLLLAPAATCASTSRSRSDSEASGPIRGACDAGALRNRLPRITCQWPRVDAVGNHRVPEAKVAFRHGMAFVEDVTDLGGDGTGDAGGDQVVT